MTPPDVGLNEQALAQLPEAERAELERTLRQFQEAISLNPLNSYVPHKKQSPFHLSKARYRAFVGGNRSGKTTAGVADDLIQLLSRDMVPDHLQDYKRWEPPVFIRVITPDLGRTMDAVVEKFQELTPRFALKGGQWDNSKGFDRTKRILRFENGSQVDFMSTEQDPDKFGGVKRHRIHYDEEPGGPHGEAIFKASSARLIDYHGDELWTMTPEIGELWVFDRLEGEQSDDMDLFRVSIDENPHLDEKSVATFKKLLTEEEYKVKALGEFVTLKDLFFDEFSDERHVRRKPVTREHIQDQAIVVGIDAGLNHPAAVWVAFDDDNVALVFAELYPENLIVADFARLIHEKNKHWGIAPDYYVIDPSVRNREPKTGENQEAEFNRHGIPAMYGQNDRGSGIMEVKRRLQQQGLFIAPDCPVLPQQFKRYRKNPSSDKEFDAIKVFDDLLDALRYAVMSRTWNYAAPSPERIRPNTNPLFEPPWRGPSKPNHSAPQGAFPT